MGVRGRQVDAGAAAPCRIPAAGAVRGWNAGAPFSLVRSTFSLLVIHDFFHFLVSGEVGLAHCILGWAPVLLPPPTLIWNKRVRWWRVLEWGVLYKKKKDWKGGRVRGRVRRSGSGGVVWERGVVWGRRSTGGGGGDGETRGKRMCAGRRGKDAFSSR